MYDVEQTPVDLPMSVDPICSVNVRRSEPHGDLGHRHPLHHSPRASVPLDAVSFASSWHVNIGYSL